MFFVNKLNPININFAVMSADSYFSVGKGMYQKYHATHMENLGTPMKWKVEQQLGYAVPAITNLSLSLELYFKIHAFQHAIEITDKRHDLLHLFQVLPHDAREAINDIFQTKYTKDSQSLIELRINQQNSAGKNSSDYKKVTAFLKAHRNSFVDWRYFYEFIGRDSSPFFSFKGMIYTIDSVIAQIRSYKGDARTEMGVSTIKSSKRDAVPRSPS